MLSYSAGMLVRAKCLRQRDLQLSADELAAMPPMLGRLRYTPNPYQGRDGRGALTCLLMPVDPNQTDPLVQLHHATISIDHRGIRIEGKEDFYKRKERHTYDQVLWCKPALEPVKPKPDPIDLEDEQAAYRLASRGL